jgi:mono/diheme cytochrome c family protein
MIPMRFKVCLTAATLAAAMTASLVAGYNITRGGHARCFDHWKAPRSARTMVNPIPATAASIHSGQVVYTQNCEACHGHNGKGDGPTGAFLSPHPANFTRPQFWKQSDGDIFWKITHGHSPMPSFQGSLSRHQRWDVINYLHKEFDPAGGGK